jgi:hypothetical protein
MVNAMRSAWNTHRHWLAAGFLFSTSLFLLLIILNWRSEQRGINQQRATGLSASTWDMRSAWSQRAVLPLSRSKQRARMDVDKASGIAGDVTREYADQEAALRNARAEERQYLVILKRAVSVKDVLEVSSKLAEVSAHIDELQTDLRLLHHQVEMSLLTTNITAMTEAQVFGIRWRPLYKAKLSLRGALSSVADYGDSMVELFVNLPVIAMWGFTILALLKVGWIVLRSIVLLFFPSLGTWLRRPMQAT